jgi:hypothetical protein
MRTIEDQIKPWGYISPFATETLQDRARCDLTITRKQTHNITMPLYTEGQLREAERRAEQRVRAEIGCDSERLDWLESGCCDVRFKDEPIADTGDAVVYCDIIEHHMSEPKERTIGSAETIRAAIDAALEMW